MVATTASITGLIAKVSKCPREKRINQIARTTFDQSFNTIYPPIIIRA